MHKTNKTSQHIKKLNTILKHIQHNGMNSSSEMLVNSQEVTCLGTEVCVTDGAR